MFAISLRKWTVTAFFTLTFVGASTYADPSYSSYDEIVRELSSTSTKSTADGNDDELIRFHAGFGLITSRTHLDLPRPLPRAKTFRGYGLNLGIDLFSPEWVAQVGFRSYDPEKIEHSHIDLKEFDFLILHNIFLTEQVIFNLGGGMTARYLEIRGPLEGQFPRSNSTPSSVLAVGMDLRVTPSIGIGFHFSHRNRLVSNSADKGGTDGSMQLIGVF